MSSPCQLPPPQRPRARPRSNHHRSTRQLNSSALSKPRQPQPNAELFLVTPVLPPPPPSSLQLAMGRLAELQRKLLEQLMGPEVRSLPRLGRELADSRASRRPWASSKATCPFGTQRSASRSSQASARTSSLPILYVERGGTGRDVQLTACPRAENGPGIMLEDSLRQGEERLLVPAPQGRGREGREQGCRA